MPRRADADPLVLQQVSQRLAHLLAETSPSQSADVPPPAASVESDLAGLEDVPPPRRFGRRHLAVVCVLLALGLLWGGWSLFRARPVAIAAPASAPAPAATATAAASASPARSPSPQPSAAEVVVHVLGAVRKPGLVTLSGSARVQDAVDAAGGFTHNADPGELNLAQLLQDGQQVVIGTDARPAGEVRGSGTGTVAGPGSGSGTTSGTGSGGGGGVLDLNAATESQLEELPGVGPVTAGKIVAWRSEHGRFSSVDELQEVDGIGPKTYAELAPHVSV